MAGTVITIAQQKGGAGKTTLAAHLALAWAAGKRRVTVVDIDPQSSLSAWYRLRETAAPDGRGIEVTSITGWRVAAEVQRLARDRDLIVIDSPPHAETEARIAVRAASLVLVPVQPSPMDLWATQPTLDLARQERVPVLLALNRVPPRANVADAMREQFAGMGVPLAKAEIGNRVALAAALAEGKSIFDVAPRSRGAAEIAALAREVLDCVGVSRRAHAR